MKKLLSILMAFGLIFAAVGCSGEASYDPDDFEDSVVKPKVISPQSPGYQFFAIDQDGYWPEVISWCEGDDRWVVTNQIDGDGGGGSAYIQTDGCSTSDGYGS